MITETHARFSGITFTLDVGPIVEGDLVAARRTGVGVTPDVTMRFLGNYILRTDGDRFVEHWAASSGS